MPSDNQTGPVTRIPPRGGHVHLMGVGGAAMAALAGMLADSGFRVTGSDGTLYEPTASLLRHLKIEVKEGFNPANLDPRPDLVVVGNVITRTNPEAEALLGSGIPYLSMPQALQEIFLRQRRVLMVAGTHGKTTSTSMVAHILESAGCDPGLFVGGIAKNFSSNYRLGRGFDFVIEGDEYDTAFFDKGPKFLHYGAAGVMLTSVEFDHADIYRDLAHVKTSFIKLARQLEPSDVIAVCADFPHALEVTRETRAHRLTYGLGAGEFMAADVRIDTDGARFAVARAGTTVARDLLLPVGGRMNIANALGAYVLLREFGIGNSQFANGLRTFAGVARRQELLGEAAGVTVIDDFAHHPTAIRATLEAIAERYPGRRILAAFEPRSNSSRRNVMQADFATAFDRASLVCLAPVYFKDNDPIPIDERLQTHVLAERISERGPRAMACDSNEEILELMIHESRAEDVAVFMSNGPFDNLKSRFLSVLRSKNLNP